jgi:hypothetical protein
VLKVDRLARVSLRQREAAGIDFAPMLDAYKDRRIQDRETLERMLSYAQSGQCRWQLLLSDLDAAAPARRCGACDNCRRIAAHEAAMAQPIVVGSEPPTITTRSSPAFVASDTVRVRRFGSGVVRRVGHELDHCRISGWQPAQLSSRLRQSPTGSGWWTYRTAAGDGNSRLSHGLGTEVSRCGTRSTRYSSILQWDFFAVGMIGLGPGEQRWRGRRGIWLEAGRVRAGRRVFCLA